MIGATRARVVDIPPDAGRALMQLARRTLAETARAENDTVGDIEHPVLRGSDFGAFVTLRRKDGALRGCVGRILAEEPLFKTIMEMTRAAALDDPRFPPVGAEEIADIRISISLVSPLSPLDDLAMLRIGEHGLYIENGFRRGVFLPQVPVEQGWDKQEFLSQTCRKANLAEDAWREPETRIACFTTQVIEEES